MSFSRGNEFHCLVRSCSYHSYFVWCRISSWFIYL